ncbi:serine hydrolase [Promicromonospora panici]|uniref:serine hydrolase n=1 Tax=Promicromonospora panici TaxID=2219658 RepID=UPI00101CA888|nr:serine hydrolase [Promicromonospora panici]
MAVRRSGRLASCPRGSSPWSSTPRAAPQSGSKSFTALAVMRQVVSGTLRLEDPVRRYLGDDLPC